LPSLPVIFSASEVNLESHELEDRIKLIFDKAPPGQKIKKVMDYLGSDAKTAQKAVEQAYQIDAQTYRHKDRVYTRLAKISLETRDASYIIVAVGGTVISGGELLAAKQMALKAIQAGAKLKVTQSIASAAYNGLAVAFNGADVVLAIGEKGAVIADNRQLKTVLVDARQRIGPVTTVLAIVDFKEGLKNKPGNWVTLAGYAQAINDWLNKGQTPPQMTVNLTDQGAKIDYSIKPDIIQTYFRSPPEQVLMRDVKAIFPHGIYFINNQTITVDKIQPQTSTNLMPAQSSPPPSPSGDFFDRFCQVFIDFMKIKGEPNYPIKTKTDCISQFNQKVERSIIKCRQAPVQERQGVVCNREAVSALIEKTVRQELLIHMQKYCQSQCHDSTCRSVCWEVSRF